MFSLFDYVIRKYNKQGVSSEMLYFNKEGKYLKKYVELYDELGNIIVTKLVGTNGKPLFVSNINLVYDDDNNVKNSSSGGFNKQYEYNDKHQKIKETFYYNGKIKSINTYKYDNRGNNIVYINKKSNGSYTKFVNEYNEHNDIITIRWFNEDDKQTQSTTFVYTYNKYGDWLTSKKYIKGKIAVVRERIITYY